MKVLPQTDYLDGWMPVLIVNEDGSFAHSNDDDPHYCYRGVIKATPEEITTLRRFCAALDAARSPVA